jgi:hypothetical protein
MLMKANRSPRPRFSSPIALPVALALGTLAFAGGVTVARQGLREWRARIVGEAAVRRSFDELARRAGVQLLPGKPLPHLDTSSSETVFAGQAKSRGDLNPEQAAAWIPGILLGRSGILPGDAATHELSIRFNWDGQPLTITWQGNPWVGFGVTGAPPPASLAAMDHFARLLQRPGERFGPRLETTISSYPLTAYAIVPSQANPEGWRGEPGRGSLREHISAFSAPGGTINSSRRGGGPEWAVVNARRFTILGFLRPIGQMLIPFLVVAALFVILLVRRRIDVKNAAWLAAAAFAVSAPSFLGSDRSLQGATWTIVGAALQGLWILLVWSAAESFLRSSEPDFTTSLDALRAGRLGPRGGRSLLLGLAAGAALAGAALAMKAAAARSAWAWPEEPSVSLPVFTGLSSPLGAGIRVAAGIMLLLALARHLVPRRWAGALAALVGAVFLEPVALHPFALELAANLAIAGALVALARRSGLTALLTAGIAFSLVPAAAISALHAGWLLATCAATGGGVAALLALGIVGVRRPPQVELERLAPPAFMRRLEEERRIKYEMDLLARMQVRLLPSAPSIPGWQIAARSLLATEASGDLYDFLPDEAGRLWIAAGDVAGHGYSCSIAQAMTSAALASLITAERTPSQVLREVDRVLRRGGAHRSFTSLALLRLDPATGEALLANAGHPFPFFLGIEEGEAAEVTLPGLPLGQGPARQYRDELLLLPPGSLLVFCSDGLFEAPDWKQEPYGYDRPRQLLQSVRGLSAAEIVEALLADWRRHLRSEAPPDDTTIVAIKRAG